MTYKYGVSSTIFGEDLTIEGVNMFITGNMVWVDELRGWNYNYKLISQKTLSGFTDNGKEWAPVKLTVEQHHILTYLCKHDSIRINRINRISQKIQVTVDEKTFIEALILTDLVYISESKNIRLITEPCQTVKTKDGFFAADNKTGKLSRWMEKYYS